MPAPAVALLVAGAGGLLIAAGALALRAAGARLTLALRLAAAPPARVGELAAGTGGRRPRRVTGRIRCADPLHGADDELLVAFHRDVELELPRAGWRGIDRIRETRAFELWDHAGALAVDPAAAAEPLVVIPRAWEGPAAALDPAFGPALARLSQRHGPPRRARSVTRSISVIDRLGLVALVEPGANGGVRLVPPAGGYVITNLELDAAMRLLAGSRPLLAVAGVAAIGLGSLAALVGTALAVVLAAVAG